MRANRLAVAISVVACSLCSAFAIAGPISGCHTSGVDTICDLYETDANGNPSEISSSVEPGVRPTNGEGVGDSLELLIITEPGTGRSDQVVFSVTNGGAPDLRANFARLLSDGCSTGNDHDTSCFFDETEFARQTVAEDPVTGLAKLTITLDVLNPLSGHLIYIIHSDNDLVEPNTAALFGLGVLVLLLRRRSRNR